MGCEGEIQIYRKNKNGGGLLGVFKCDPSKNCFRKIIWGDNGSKGIGLPQLASNLSGIPVESLQASFNSNCILPPAENS